MSDHYPSYNIEKYPKSNKITTREYHVHTSDQHYAIFNYDKNFICFDEPDEITQYRSVIMSHPQRHLLAFSPPRGIHIDMFKKKYSIQDDDLILNEMIEGTMVQLFYDKRISSWEIATKSAVGGYYWLSEKNAGHNKYKPTVRHMFLEALCYPIYMSFLQIPLFEQLSRHYSYTFILQHPANPIVLHPTKPRIYLVAVYDIAPCRAISIPTTIFQTWDCFASSSILFPKTFHFHHWDEITGKIGLFNRTSFEYMGCIATHLGTGERCVIQNPVYNEILRMRKVNPGLFYQFLCLRRVNSVDAYLKYYPQLKRKFQQFHSICNEFIELAHTHYLARYVWRNCNDISKKYAPYIDAVHREIYIPSLKTKKKMITCKVMRDYLFSLSPNEILYALQYEKRDEYVRRMSFGNV